VLKASKFVPFYLYIFIKTENSFFTLVLYLNSDHLICISNMRDFKKNYRTIVPLCICYEGTKFVKRKSNVLKNEM